MKHQKNIKIVTVFPTDKSEDISKSTNQEAEGDDCLEANQREMERFRKGIFACPKFTRFMCNDDIRIT
jgi:hypothetical protein